MRKCVCVCVYIYLYRYPTYYWYLALLWRIFIYLFIYSRKWIKIFKTDVKFSLTSRLEASSMSLGPIRYTLFCKCIALLWQEWTSSYQCTSWLFCSLDGFRFFIRRQMRFITIHFFLLLTIVFSFFCFLAVFPGHDLTHSYPAHFPTLVSIAPTLLPYLLSLIDTVTLITSYPIDLAIVLTTYPTYTTTLLT
jgi:hypothetical protein